MGKRVVDTLLAESASVFGILDGARDRTISRRVRASGFEHKSLYDGEAGEDLAPFGPWLVELPRNHDALAPWIDLDWGKSNGVYLACDAPFSQVRGHLRRFLKVELEGGRRVYFRFYDPRVLRAFLPGCTYEEWQEFFGPIESYFTESADGRALLRFHRDADTPEPERVELAPAGG